MGLSQFPKVKVGRAADVLMLILLAILVIGSSVRTTPGYSPAPPGWEECYNESWVEWVECYDRLTSTSTQTATTTTSTTATTQTTSTTATTQTTGASHITASYDAAYLRFEGWGYTPGREVRVYIDGEPASDAGPVAPDGCIWGTVLIILSPGQHTVYLVDLWTRNQSNTVTIIVQ